MLYTGQYIRSDRDMDRTVHRSGQCYGQYSTLERTVLCVGQNLGAMDITVGEESVMDRRVP